MASLLCFFWRIGRMQEWNRGGRHLGVSLTRSTIYSCLLNWMLGIGFRLYSGEMCSVRWLDVRAQIPKNGFVFSWRNREFLEPDSWHTLGLRTGVPDTSIDRRHVGQRVIEALIR